MEIKGLFNQQNKNKKPSKRKAKKYMNASIGKDKKWLNYIRNHMDYIAFPGVSGTLEIISKKGQQAGVFSVLSHNDNNITLNEGVSLVGKAMCVILPPEAFAFTTTEKLVDTANPQQTFVPSGFDFNDAVVVTRELRPGLTQITYAWTKYMKLLMEFAERFNINIILIEPLWFTVARGLPDSLKNSMLCTEVGGFFEIATVIEGIPVNQISCNPEKTSILESIQSLGQPLQSISKVLRKSPDINDIIFFTEYELKHNDHIRKLGENIAETGVTIQRMDLAPIVLKGVVDI